jgi:hypothetical protein
VGRNSERVLRQFAMRGSKRCDRLARRAIFVSLRLCSFSVPLACCQGGIADSDAKWRHV